MDGVDGGGRGRGRFIGGMRPSKKFLIAWWRVFADCHRLTGSQGNQYRL